MVTIEGRPSTSPSNSPIINTIRVDRTSLSASFTYERGDDGVKVGRKSQSSKAVVVTGR